jgi:zinc protease
VATQAGFNADLRADPGLLVAYAIAAGGKSTAEIGKALLAEVARLAAAPPSAAELAKVKTQLITQAFTSRQTPLGLGSALAEAAVLQGDPARVNSELDALQRVSAADVQRVLRRYVLDAHKVAIDYRQEEAAKP